MSTVEKKIKKDCADSAFLKKNLHKLVKDLTSEKYHGMFGTWSSSQFKDMLEDPDYFIKKYIKREIDRTETDAMDTGTYFHTGLLEPHKVHEEIAVFEGKTRYGSKFNAFKEIHKGKTIITKDMKEQGDLMIQAVKASPTSMMYLDGEAEVSLFVELEVHNGRIYAPKFNKVLTRSGWEEVDIPLLKSGYKMIVKVRADTLGNYFVSDLKSTSGNARREDDIRGSISKYRYDLSAALYLDMFNLVRPEVHEFVWIFASKKANNAAPWRASRDQILVGRAKYMHAVLKLADCAMSKWELVDCLREAEPLHYEREWLREKDTDLL